MESVDDLRNKLIELGLKEEEANSIKGKGNLLSKIEEMSNSLDIESLTSMIALQEDMLEDVKEEKELEPPEYGDPNWQEYVLSFFTESELYDSKYPTLNGMRRVAQNLLGELEFSGIISLNSSMPEDTNGRAYCLYELVFSDFLGKGRKVFRAAADASQFNMNDTYSIYPVAIAENRSEVRAFRKALMLSVVGAEEIKDNNSHFQSVIQSVDEYKEDEKMSSTQEIILRTKAQSLNINLSKIMKDNMTKKDATELVKLLNSYQSDTTNIPEEIKL